MLCIDSHAELRSTLLIEQDVGITGGRGFVHSMTCNDSHTEVDVFDIFSPTSQDTHLEVGFFRVQFKEAKSKEQPVKIDIFEKMHF